MNAAAGALAVLPSFAEAGERAGRAVLAGHACVVLLGEPAETEALLGHATALLARAGVTPHVVPPERFTPTDLLRPGDRGVLAVAGAERLHRPQLLAMEAHLRRAPRDRPRARLLLAGTEVLRTLTTSPDLTTLHRDSLLLDPPALQPAEGRALLEALAPRRAPRTRAVLAELGGDQPALLLRLARIGGLRRALLRVASTPALTHPLAHPLTVAVLSCPVLVAVLLLHASIQAGPRYSAMPPPATVSLGAAPTIADPDAAPDDAGTGVEVDHENPDQAAAEAAAHEPHLVAARAGDTLAGMYRRVYRGLARPPSFASVEVVNPFAPAAGVRLVFPAPSGGWPRP